MPEREQLPFKDIEPEYAADALDYYNQLAREGGYDNSVQEFVLAVLDAELATRSDDEVQRIAEQNRQRLQLQMKIGQVVTYEIQRRRA